MSAVDRTRLPKPGPEPTVHFPKVSKRRLANGIEVRTVEHRGVPVVSFLLLLAAGSAADPTDRPGLAALTADMLDEGSGDRSALDIEDALSGMGAQFETEVGSDATVLSLLTLPRFVPPALALLADIVIRPRLACEDFERVRELRLNRLRQLRDLAPAVADISLARLVYRDHPYGRLPIGSVRGLESVRCGEIEQFHRDVWRPELATVIATGDATHEELFDAVQDAFGNWQPAPGVSNDLGTRNPLAEAVSCVPATPIAIVDRPGAAQSEFRLGQVAVPRVTPDYYPLIVLNAILGGQFVSRLNMNLREDKGYTYGVRSGFEFRRAAGPFIVQAAVQTAVTADAVKETLAELKTIAGSRPATPDELDLARSALTKGYARNFETASQIGRGLAQLALYDLPDDTLEQFVPSVQAVEIAAVTEAAQRFDPGKMTVAIVGDREKVEPGLRALGLGAVTVLSDTEWDG